MKLIISKVAKTIRQILGHLPTAIPVGLTEFHTWADSIIDDYDLTALADRDSMKFVLATTVMRLDPDKASKPKYHFVKILRNAASKQVSSAVFQNIKQKQAEATANAQAVASDGQKQPAV